MKRLTSFLLFFCVAFPALAAAEPVGGSTGGIFHILLVLILVLGLMVGAAWLLKRFNATGTSSGSDIKIIGGVSVGNRERIMVVEVADQWIVVGVTPSNINALSTMPKQETQTSQETPTLSNNFAVKLKQLIEKRNAK